MSIALMSKAFFFFLLIYLKSVYCSNDDDKSHFQSTGRYFETQKIHWILFSDYLRHLWDLMKIPCKFFMNFCLYPHHIFSATSGLAKNVLPSKKYLDLQPFYYSYNQISLKMRVIFCRLSARHE